MKTTDAQDVISLVEGLEFSSFGYFIDENDNEFLVDGQGNLHSISEGELNETTLRRYVPSNKNLGAAKEFVKQHRDRITQKGKALRDQARGSGIGQKVHKVAQRGMELAQSHPKTAAAIVGGAALAAGAAALARRRAKKRRASKSENLLSYLDSFSASIEETLSYYLDPGGNEFIIDQYENFFLVEEDGFSLIEDE